MIPFDSLFDATFNVLIKMFLSKKKQDDNGFWNICIYSLRKQSAAQLYEGPRERRLMSKESQRVNQRREEVEEEEKKS